MSFNRDYGLYENHARKKTSINLTISTLAGDLTDGQRGCGDRDMS